MKSYRALLAGLAVCAAVIPASAHAEPLARRPSLSAGAIVASRGAGVVEISTINAWVPSGSAEPEPEFAPPDTFGDQLARPQPISLAHGEARDLASGFVLTADGYIVSSAHVLWDAQEAQVRLQDGRHFPARLVGLDRISDVALLKIDATGLSPAPIGDSSRLAVGDWVAAIGSPFGFPGSVTAGIVSAKNRALSGSGETGFLQTDVAINPGSSGSPLFNADGEIVGLNSLIYSGSGGYMGVSFSVPINLAVDIAWRLRSQGRIRRAWLGARLQGMTAALAHSFGVRDPTGALVVQVTPGGPAAQAGLLRGDIITAFNGAKVRDFSSLALQMSDHGTSTPGTLEVWREGLKRTATVLLAEAPASAPRPLAAPAPGDLPRLGLALAESGRDLQAQLGIKGGLLVRQAAGLSRSEGIQAGDVLIAANELSLDSVEDFDRVLSRLEPGSSLALLVMRDGNAAYVPLRIPAAKKR
ncbi:MULTISPECIES: trypsin-like peptidase domain-containing protein [unclassified Polaromonas]|uniref:trypsin-like peptidase domain-containing protein n=1 Tax=unclassified Polaromonas TaxID=2638319 RepID=UPI00129DB105|nr:MULTISPECIES: trypsin-like peptidase domain-containing protein [unclassified Polaromonas]QGJ19393.1 PDZ domain-containing protein [Polaromonas sp. Pch-P]